MPAEKKSLYTPADYQACLARIDKLTADSRPQWGKMTSGQMLAHCAEVQEITNGKELQNTPLLVKLMRGMIRKMVVGDKPYPKNAQTHSQFKQTTDRNFDEEIKHLLAALDFFVNQEQQEALQTKHPLFGKMTLAEKGWIGYKHLDHHLSQFHI